MALLLTMAFGRLLAGTARERDRARFANAVHSTSDRIAGRFDTYVAMLRGAAGLFDASGAVTRAEFDSYVERLDLNHYYPGAQGIGYSHRLRPGEEAAVVAEARAAGLDGFRLFPGGPRPETHAIVYLEPLDTLNRAALGYDMFTDPERRRAMERARDTGQPAMSGRVVLRQEIAAGGHEPGFLIFVPVYRPGRPGTVEERRARLDGFVYAPFRARDLFDRIFGSESEPRVAFRVYDGVDTVPSALLYDSRTEPRARRAPAFVDTRRTEVAGRRVTLAFESLPQFEAGLNVMMVPAVLLAGLACSLVLFLIARGQTRARAMAEDRADALRAALAERERLVSLVESSSDLVGFADTEGRLLYLNDAGRRLLGLGGAGETGETKIGDFFAEPEAGRLEREVLPAVRERGRWRGEARFRSFSGDAVLPVQATLFAIPDPETGETMGLGMVTRDVSAERRAKEEVEEARRAAERSARESRDLAARLKMQTLELETQVEQARALNDELQRANRSKSTFLATMSHELRTPLNAVIGYADLLQAGIPEPIPAGAERQVERIALASRHLLSVIEEILSYARIEAGREVVEAAEVDLREVVRESAAIVEPLAAEKALRFSAPARVEPATLVTDARKLRQILVNLLGNAIKFTAAGEIGFSVERVGGWVEFRVRDTGIGIAEGDAERIFEPFRQVDQAATRVAGGTGLGLSVSRHLARMLGGDISVESRLGEGSTFTVRLPLALSAAPGAPRQAPSDFSAPAARKAS